ncbi:hypothetical protein [Paenibacillus gallinarum]|uniref:HEPN domain-containing protein n=1 Tax=Paenibacillus gallinarum TaxID=2762232 RepID=A0ABR8SW64_9BACL|nr:hypothetical protein [Paenibacillus gallinarum]MBD7967747.1 hypothetical protein [Paenibacillus gallinarum]
MEKSKEYFIFQQAELFFRATNLISSELTKDIGESLEGKELDLSIGIPEMVNGVFSIELYLKCLNYIRNNEIKRLHNIIDLYNSLPEEDQAAIRSRYRSTKSSDPNRQEFLDRNFDDLLSAVDRAFTEWRYIYEYPNHGKKTSDMNRLILAVRDYLLAIRPDLKND